MKTFICHGTALCNIICNSEVNKCTSKPRGFRCEVSCNDQRSETTFNHPTSHCIRRFANTNWRDPISCHLINSPSLKDIVDNGLTIREIPHYPRCEIKTCFSATFYNGKIGRVIRNTIVTAKAPREYYITLVNTRTLVVLSGRNDAEKGRKGDSESSYYSLNMVAYALSIALGVGQSRRLTSPVIAYVFAL